LGQSDSDDAGVGVKHPMDELANILNITTTTTTTTTTSSTTQQVRKGGSEIYGRENSCQ
jgi:hypothetical protein